MENLCKTIHFAPHTEGQPKLKFSEPGFLRQDLWKTYAKPYILHPILRANLSSNSANYDFSWRQNLWKTLGLTSKDLCLEMCPSIVCNWLPPIQGEGVPAGDCIEMCSKQNANNTSALCFSKLTLPIHVAHPQPAHFERFENKSLKIKARRPPEPMENLWNHVWWALRKDNSIPGLL